MVIPKINSAHGSDTRNIINRVIDSINTQGKSIQDLVAEGQLTEDQYAELITVINGLLKSGYINKYDLSPGLRSEINQLRDKIDKGNVSINDLRPELLNFIHDGAGGPLEILSIPRNRSVSPEKTTFIETSSNLVEIKNVMYNTDIDGTTGEPIAVSGTSTLLNHFIPVEAGEDYTFKRVIKAYVYDSGGNLIQNLGVYSTSDPVTLTMGSTGAFCKLTVMSDLIDIQMNKGDTLLPYEPFYNNLSDSIDIDFIIEPDSIGSSELKRAAVTPEKTSFIEFSKNMINEKTLESGFTLSPTNGEKVPNASNSVSEKIKVKPNTTYTGTISRYGFYDINGDFITSSATGSNSLSTITTTPFTEYMIVVVHQSIDKPMVNEGETLLPYTPHHKPRLSSDIEVSGDSGGGNTQTPILDTKNFDKFTIAGKLDGFYEQAQLPARATGSSAQAMNDNYDGYVTSHPHYVSREKITDSVTGHSIYLYDFNPDIVNNETSASDPAITKFPTIFIVCGTHGTERISPLVTNHFFNQLVNNWQENELLETLRWGVRFKVIPMLNPDGWNSDSRQNGNGVDLNRQFPTGWSAGTPGTSTYGGTAPLTEPEAIAVNEILENEEDLIYFCDFHNFSSSENNFIWNAGATKLNNNLAKSHISQMFRKWKKKYDWMPQDETSIMGYSSGTPNGSMAAHGANLGIQSSTYEVSMGVPNDPEGESYSSNTMTLATEAFINWILLNVKNNIDL